MKTHKALHSIEHFGPTRKFWWNMDFLELMSRRWRLAAVRSVLDVGCGVGHWTVALSSVLAVDAQVVGIDRAAEWVEIANTVAQGAGKSDRRRFQVGLVLTNINIRRISDIFAGGDRRQPPRLCA